MHVIFRNVTYENKNLVWEYDSKTNSAYLIYRCEDDDVPLNKESVLKELQKKYLNKGMVFYEDRVVIDNVDEFSKQCAMHVLSMEAPSRSAAAAAAAAASESPRDTRISTLRANGLNEISTDLEIRPFFLNRLKSTKSRSNSLEEREPLRLDYRCISIDNLIPEADAGIFRNTRAVTTTLPQVTGEKRKQVIAYIRTHELFFLETQFEKNSELYPVKAELMRVIGTLFDEVLNPIYMIWAEKMPFSFRRQLYFFLQNTVNSIMVNAPFNNSPTEFEVLPQSDLEDKFRGNQAYQSFAIKKIRAARAEIVLVHLTYFIDSDLPVDLIHNSEVNEQVSLLQCYKEILSFNKFISLNSVINESQRDWLILIKSIVDKMNALLPLDEELASELKKIQPGDSNEVPRFKDFSSPARKEQFRSADKYVDNRIKKIALSSFKSCISDKPYLVERIQRELKIIQRYMVQVSEIEYKFKLVTDTLDKQLNQLDEPVIGGYHSFKHIILNYLDPKIAVKFKTPAEFRRASMSIVEQIISSTIEELNSAPSSATSQLISKLPQKYHNNFYLAEDWVSGVVASIEGVDSTKLIKGLNKSKIIDEYCQSIVAAVVVFFNDKSMIVQQSLVSEPIFRASLPSALSSTTKMNP